MKVLVLGGGGREHALVWKLRQSAAVKEVVAAPGNPGIARIAANLQPVSQRPDDLVALARSFGADLTVVGPEAPLVEGVADAFTAAGLAIFGPSRAAAQLEGSKAFSKRFMERHRIPTARYVQADNLEVALRALPAFGSPVVIKADGLAAGKGVVIAEDHAAAAEALTGMFSGALVGSAGSRVVIEECLQGEEVSFIALSDGEHVIPLEPSQDHKRIFDHDEGPNTGGMGAYSDSRLLTAAQREEVLARVIQPTVDGMAAEGNPFRGFLYAGLMMTKDGPRVLEFNVRLGDPETQCLLHRMTGDLAALLHQACHEGLAHAKAEFREGPSVCIVQAAAGYPGTPRSGDLIEGLDGAEIDGAVVFHAGTRQTGRGIETNGGRVLGITAGGKTLPEAIEHAYAAANRITFSGRQMRTDIGAKGLLRWRDALQWKTSGGT